jgi:hypothetical protein
LAARDLTVPRKARRVRHAVAGDAVRTGKHFKTILPRDGNQRDAGRIARAVDAETATITGTPMAVAFCTISIETRLLSTIKPFSVVIR